ncbi:MAG: hypothetical protein RLZZ470_731 [Pseudomonadota bacterium]|jgi:uncharacterized SAM-binding protein YcdF (DUF218 family)
MSFLGPLKPLLTTLVMPPAGPLLLLVAAAALAVWLGRSTNAANGAQSRPRDRLLRTAWAMAGLAVVSLWVLSCQATAYGLNQWLLKTYPALQVQELKKAQAIVVLGGGVNLHAPEYGQTVLGGAAHQRLLYGVHLARQSHLPLVYSGGKGWAAPKGQLESEAAVAAYELQRDSGMRFHWVDDQSRDTRENAQRSFEQLSAQGIQTIALVTNDWHMQRSVRNFEQAGFQVLPAPMGYIQPPMRWDNDYLPSSGGMQNTTTILREWLGLLLT